jgi:hypothetical protein
MRIVMKAVSCCAVLAALALGNPARATTILDFGQTNPADTITAVATGATTTLTAVPSVGAPGSIPVTITTIGGTPLPPALSIAAFETLSPLIGPPGTGITATGPAVTSGGVTSEPVSGVLQYTSAPLGLGTNFLTVTFTGVLRGTLGGTSLNLTADNAIAGQSVTYTSGDTRITGPPGPNFTTAPIRSFSLGLTNVQPPSSLTGITFSNFTAQMSGPSSANLVPEPASIVMASIAMVTGIGLYGFRRLRSRA